MGLGKSFNQNLKSSLDLQTTFNLCKKVCADSKLKIKNEGLEGNSFSIKAAEPMKWLTTNWPNNIAIVGEVFQDNIIVKLTAGSNGTSITQDRNINDFLNNFSNNLKVYLD